VALTLPILCFCSRLYDGTGFGIVPQGRSLNLPPKSRDDASDFRPRTGRIRDQGRVGGRPAQSFVDQVMKAAAKANAAH
jgi:hypothetical protein